MNVYIKNYSELFIFQDKILFAAFYLWENVFKWFKSIMKNFLKKSEEDQKEKMK